MESDLYLGFDGPGLGVLVAQAVAWLGVLLACLVAVRRTWAWPGLAGGVVGLVASVTLVVDHFQVRSHATGDRRLGAHVYDAGSFHDLPGFVIDRGLQAPLDWAQAVAVALVAVALATSAVLSRRRAQHASA